MKKMLQGIIEKYNNPIVAVNNSNDELRLCLAMYKILINTSSIFGRNKS